MKRFISFFLAFALLLSVLPFKLNTLAETAANTSGENFNFFNADSYYWKKASWSNKNSMAEGQLQLYNGIYLYTGYELSSEKVSYIVNHNGLTSGSYDIYLRSAVDFDSADTSSNSIQSGNPILLRYSLKDKEFLLFEGTFNAAAAKMSVDLTDGNDHTVEVITEEDRAANTTTVQLCVDGKLLVDYTNSAKPDHWTFDGIKGSGNIGFANYNNTQITFKGFYVDGVTYDPYYTERFVADFENADGLTISNPESGAQASVSTEEAYAGTASMYMDDTSSGTVSFALDPTKTAKALKPGVTYRVTAWVKAVDTVGKNLNFTVKSVAARNSVSGATGNITKSFTWWGVNNNWATMMDQSTAGDWCKVLITSEFTVKEGYEFPIVSIWAKGEGKGWYIDDIAFEAVMENEPVVSENAEYGTVSYTNYKKLNTQESSVDTVAVCVGDRVTATATAASGYRFAGWYKDGKRVSTAVKYTYITDGTTIKAHFEKSDSSYIYQDWEQQGIGGFAYKVNAAGAIITDSVSHTGNYSVKVATNSGQANYLFSCSDNQTPALEAGKTYQAFIWVKPGETGRMNIKLHGVADRNSNANTTPLVSFNDVTRDKINNAATDSTDDGWYRVCIGYFTAVADRPYASIYCWVDTSVSAEFEWYYDDLELIMLEDSCAIQDFENTPANFSISSGNAQAEVTTAESMSGDKSLMIKTGDTGENVFAALFDSSTVRLETGSIYRVTMWMKFKEAGSSNVNIKLFSVNEANNCTASAIGGTAFADEQLTKGRLQTYYTNKAGVKYYGVDSNSATGWYEACITDYYTAQGAFAKLYAWVPANTEFYIDDVVFTKVNTVSADIEGAGQVSASNELTYQALNSSGVTVSAGVAEGQTVHLTALADKGYTFKGWRLGDSIVSTDASMDVVPSESVSYTAVFEGEKPVYDALTRENIASTLTTGNVNTVTNEQFISEALLSTGNSDRIASAMKKAANGENITVGFIGGSITEGAGASDKTKSWAYNIYDWFVQAFPASEINYVNVAIAGSYSRLGVTYTETQLMAEKPDIVFLDYSVNDSNGMYKDSYEAIIRTILAGENDPGLVMIDFTRESTNEWSYHNEQMLYDALGVYYGLPIINIHHAITPFFDSGLLLWEDYSDDSIHPNDTGHAMVAAAVTSYLKDAKAYSEENRQFAPEKLKADCYYGKTELESALMSYAGEFRANADGFTSGGTVSRFGWDAYKSSGAGSTLTFTLKNCTEAIIVYGQSGSVVPADMEIYVNGWLYSTESPVQDSTPWCVANISSVEPVDMEIRIVALEDSVCNIAGVYAAIDEDTADAVRALRRKIDLLTELDLDTADAEISAVKDALASSTEDVLALADNADSIIADAEKAVDDIAAIVSAGDVGGTAEITSSICEADRITLVSGIDVRQYNSFVQAGFEVSTYGIAMIPSAKTEGALKKETSGAQNVEYSDFGKRTVFKTHINHVNTDARKMEELTVRTYVTYTRDGIAINVYNDSDTVMYSENK